MTTSTTTITTNIVTREQIDACSRFYNEAGQAFYMVRSESDPNVEYKVEAQQHGGRYFIVCDCPAGQKGINCKHKKWAAAAAQVDRTDRKVEAMSREWKEPIDASYFPEVTCTNVDSETLARVMRASLANKQPPRSLVEQDYRHYNDNKPFSLMR